ncbi:MAG: hypothetical protein OES09_12530 [Gammaproteobacteria bacterium]|nr:hypothetical protein [Gammaproteobacteria bacterium]
MSGRGALKAPQASSVPIESELSQQTLIAPAPGLSQPASLLAESEPSYDASASVVQNSPSNQEADKLEAAATLSQAVKTATPYEIIGPNTKNFVDLYNFYAAAGWNDAIDGMTLKSCPEGYEIFCEMRHQFIQLYQQMGGDPEKLIDLFRAMDLREYVYQQAVAADMYQKQYTQPQGKKLR